MNEQYAKVLQFSIVFWLIMGFFAVTFTDRIQTYFVYGVDASDYLSITSDVQDVPSLMAIVWYTATFQVTETVPLWITVILDIMAVLTIIAVIMAVTNR